MATPLAGNLEAEIEITENSTIGSITAIVVNSTEQLAYLANGNHTTGTLIYALNTANFSYTRLSPATEPLLPKGLALSPDNSTLYMLTEPGELYSVSTSTGAKTLLTNFSSSFNLGGSWCDLVRSNLNSTILYAIRSVDSRLFAYDLVSNSIKIFHTFPFITTAICLDENDNFYVAGYYPGSHRLFRFFPSQGRWVLAAGNGVEGKANGEALLQAELLNPNTITCTKDGTIVYALNDRGGLRIVFNGSVGSLNNLVSNEVNAGMALMHNANKIIFSQAIHALARGS